jgi:hypothetical protein
MKWHTYNPLNYVIPGNSPPVAGRAVLGAGFADADAGFVERAVMVRFCSLLYVSVYGGPPLTLLIQRRTGRVEYEYCLSLATRWMVNGSASRKRVSMTC